MILIKTSEKVSAFPKSRPLQEKWMEKIRNPKWREFDAIEETDGHLYDSLAEKDISYFSILFLLFLLHML